MIPSQNENSSIMSECPSSAECCTLKTLQHSFPFNLIFVILLITGCSHLSDQPHQDKTPGESDKWYETWDSDQMRKYRAERYQSILADVERTSLTTRHQRILAKALSKLYVGIPTCSYTAKSQSNGKLLEIFDSDGPWLVEAGGYQDFRGELGDAVWIRKPLISAQSPFPYVPTHFFTFAKVAVENETKSHIKFAFSINKKILEQSREWSMEWVLAPATWVVEFTVDKERQAPETLHFFNEKPFNRHLAYNLTDVQLTLRYSYSESCDFHAMTSRALKIEGTVLSVGKVNEEVFDSYTDVNCESPTLYLHLQEPSVNFVDHVRLRSRF